MDGKSRAWRTAPHRDHAEEQLAHHGIFQLVSRQRRFDQARRNADDTDAAAT
jgi:hypothetical protein